MLFLSHCLGNHAWLGQLDWLGQSTENQGEILHQYDPVSIQGKKCSNGVSKPSLNQLFIIMVTNNNNNSKMYLCFWRILELSGSLLVHAILTKCKQCAIVGWGWTTKAEVKGNDFTLTLTLWSLWIMTSTHNQSDICMVDWTIKDGAVSQVDELIWKGSIQL